MDKSIGIQAALAEIEKLGTQSIEVEEWLDPETDQPLKIYWKPLSPEKVVKYSGKKKTQVQALIITENATDKNGKKLFNPGDHIPLSKGGNFKTISKVANAILGETDEDGEESEDDDPLDAA